MENTKLVGKNCSLRDAKPKSFSFHIESGECGRLTIDDNGKLSFSGDVNESAEVLFKRVCEIFDDASTVAINSYDADQRRIKSQQKEYDEIAAALKSLTNGISQEATEITIEKLPNQLNNFDVTDN